MLKKYTVPVLSCIIVVAATYAVLYAIAGLMFLVAWLLS